VWLFVPFSIYLTLKSCDLDGYSSSLEMAPFDILFCNYVYILLRFRDIKRSIGLIACSWNPGQGSLKIRGH